MKEDVVVVGSGASGVHFALTLLKKGRKVTMLDVGHRPPEPLNPDQTIPELKSSLPDPAGYFLGDEFQSVVFPGAENYYAQPPSKDYVFETAGAPQPKREGFEPLLSYAQGGLGQAWTGGSYPFNEEELAEFPFGFEEIRPFYDEVGRRIGVVGDPNDDLAAFTPTHDGLMPALDLDEHGKKLSAEYARQRRDLNEQLLWYLGRSRVAVLSRDFRGRKACSYLGRCMWGCPTGAFYTPSLTLAECQEFENFTYRPGLRVSHFEVDSSGAVSGVVAGDEVIEAEKVVLATGALTTSHLYLESWRRAADEVIQLPGLLDNRQLFIPFLNLRMLGKRYDPKSYQYHQLAFAFRDPDPRNYVHGQITSLTTAMVHPVIQNLPVDLRAGTKVFKNLHAALGLANAMLADYRRPDCYATLDETGRLVLHYETAPNEDFQIRDTLERMQAALGKIGCVAPPNMTQIRPIGGSVHYAGTLPMIAESDDPHTTTTQCESRAFKNLFVVDGATFPFLPAKQYTFTLMANAVRVASEAF
ncbi:MAG: choline dehydrogenase-like flavoprotein [Verrucomicrobiales bacterium]|jgi:choline dehydrogenase-like flavoprotein